VIEPIGDEIRAEAARFPARGNLAAIAAVWPDAVGVLNARNAWPARIGRDGTLHVATADSLWAFELTQLAPAILERLRAALGEACPPQLRFAQGTLPALAPAGPPPTAPAALRPGPEERAAAERLVAAVGDGELRAAVARAAAASLARAAADRRV
jgi:hypothetical protein